MKLDPAKIANEYFGWVLTAATIAIVGAIIDVQFLKAEVKQMQVEVVSDRKYIRDTHKVTCLLAIRDVKLTDQEKASFCAGVR